MAKIGKIVKLAFEENPDTLGSMLTKISVACTVILSKEPSQVQ